MSWYQNARRSHNIKIDNSSFEKVVEFKFLETNLMNQKFFRKKLRADLSHVMLLSCFVESFTLQFAIQKD